MSQRDNVSPATENFGKLLNLSYQVKVLSQTATYFLKRKM